MLFEQNHIRENSKCFSSVVSGRETERKQKSNSQSFAVETLSVFQHIGSLRVRLKTKMLFEQNHSRENSKCFSSVASSREKEWKQKSNPQSFAVKKLLVRQHIFSLRERPKIKMHFEQYHIRKTSKCFSSVASAREKEWKQKSNPQSFAVKKLLVPQHIGSLRERSKIKMHFEQHHIPKNSKCFSSVASAREEEGKQKSNSNSFSVKKFGSLSEASFSVFDLKTVFGETAVSYRLRTGGERIWKAQNQLSTSQGYDLNGSGQWPLPS